MKRTNRIIAAATLALERNALLLDGGSGLTEVRINIKLDTDGRPCRAFVMPQFESFIVSKSIEGFTFPDT